jgi:serine/threonine protein kinase
MDAYGAARHNWSLANSGRGRHRQGPRSMSTPPVPALPTADDDRTVVIRNRAALSQNALPPGTVLGEFEIERLIGEGGFGIVYLARDTVLERGVALKEYLPSALANRGLGLTVNVTSARHEETFQAGLRSFLNEARLLAQFDHPALVKVYRFWEANGTAYMIMPYYAGATLKDAVQHDGAPAEAQLTTLLGQLLDALDTLHRANCLHRDIAPDNIVMLASGRPVLLDFGAARRVISDRTQALTVILKPGYAPIEQYAELPSLKQGPWTDVYALAGVAHFMITGTPPPPSVARTLTDPYVPLEQAAAGRYSVRLLRAIDRALAVRPEDRQYDVAAFRALLGLSGPATSGVTADQASTTAATPPRKRATAVVGMGAAIALAAIVAGAALLISGRPAETPPLVEKADYKQAAAPSSLTGPRDVPAPPETRSADMMSSAAGAPAVSAEEPGSLPAPRAAPEPLEMRGDTKSSSATQPAVAADEPSSPPAPRAAARPPEPRGSTKSSAAAAAATVGPGKNTTVARSPANIVVAPPGAPTVGFPSTGSSGRGEALEFSRLEPAEVAPPQAPAPTPPAPNPLAAIVAAALDDGEKCLRAKRYDCAITNANNAIRAEPGSARAHRLKRNAEDAQQEAVKQITVE